MLPRLEALGKCEGGMMIDGLVKIVDRLIELVKYREEKSRRIFEKLIEPIFADLLGIHKDYLAMFEEVRSMLPEAGDAKKKQEKKLGQALQYLSKRRTEFEPIRIKLREISMALTKHKTNKKERFILAVVSYLWWTNRRQGLGSLSSHLVEEIQIAALVSSLPPPGLRTPSQQDELVKISLHGLKAIGQPSRNLGADDLNKYIGVILFQLRQKFATVAEAYAEIFAKVRSE